MRHVSVLSKVVMAMVLGILPLLNLSCGLSGDRPIVIPSGAPSQFEFQLGQTRIVVEAEAAEPLFRLEGEQLVQVNPSPEDTHHLEITITDPVTGEPIPYVTGTVTLVSEDGQIVATRALMPTFAEHGFHYSAFVPMSSGRHVEHEEGTGTTLPTPTRKFELRLRLDPPQFAREGEVRNFWLTPLEAIFPFSGGRVVGMLGKAWRKGQYREEEHMKLGEQEMEGMHIEVEAEEPKSLWVFQDGRLIELMPDPTDTHHLEVMLEGELEEEHRSRNGEIAAGKVKLPYARVVVKVIDKQTGQKVAEKELLPIFGDHGFHYGHNFALPEQFKLEVKVEPPTFLRHHEVKDMWRHRAEAHFEGMH